MTMRHKFTSAAAIAGVGMMALTLHACGGKPAPAEEAEGVKGTADNANAQTMRVTQVELRDLSDEVLAAGRLVVREEASVGTELTGYRVLSLIHI